MNDIFGRVSVILMAAIVMVTIPLMAMKERAKTAAQLYILTCETEFIDSVCNTGFISRNMYEQLYNEIADLPGIYDIEMTVERKELLYENGEVSYVSLFFDTEDIKDQLQQENTFFFYRNDYVRIQITRQKNNARMLGFTDDTVNVFYGGTIKYEAY